MESPDTSVFLHERCEIESKRHHTCAGDGPRATTLTDTAVSVDKAPAKYGSSDTNELGNDTVAVVTVAEADETTTCISSPGLTSQAPVGRCGGGVPSSSAGQSRR